jgi:hypothetical protein
VINLDRANGMTFEHHAAPYDRSGLHAALVQRDLPGREFLRRVFFP